MNPKILPGHGMDPQLDQEVERRCHADQQVKNMSQIQIYWLGHGLDTQLDLKVEHGKSVTCGAAGEEIIVFLFGGGENVTCLRDVQFEGAIWTRSRNAVGSPEAGYLRTLKFGLDTPRMFGGVAQKTYVQANSDNQTLKADWGEVFGSLVPLKLMVRLRARVMARPMVRLMARPMMGPMTRPMARPMRDWCS